MRQPEERLRPAGGETNGPATGAANLKSGSTLPARGDLAEHIEHFRAHLLADVLNTARRRWWLKRAEDFERAKPRPGEFAGKATIEELRARWLWCHRTAQACRNKAALVPLTGDEFHAEIVTILNEGVA